MAASNKEQGRREEGTRRSRKGTKTSVAPQHRGGGSLDRSSVLTRRAQGSGGDNEGDSPPLLTTYNSRFLEEFSVGDTPLGKGGSGKVVEGVHLPTSMVVAVKVIDPLKRPNAERARKLFAREVKLHAMVSGLPGVIRLLGASQPTSQAKCYLATELATTRDLFVLLRKRKALAEKHVREVVAQLLTAVIGLHRKGICHRDIKPENILLERSGLNSSGFIFKLADFGHAGLMPGDNSRLHTRDCGTPGYKAPELRNDWKQGHGLEADLWSVGAIMNDCFSFKSRQMPVSDENFWNREVLGTVSTSARNLLACFLEPDHSKRITAEEALRHPWLMGEISAMVCRGSHPFENANTGTSTSSTRNVHSNEKSSSSPKGRKTTRRGGAGTGNTLKMVRKDRRLGLGPQAGCVIMDVNNRNAANAAASVTASIDSAVGRGDLRNCSLGRNLEIMEAAKSTISEREQVSAARSSA